MVAVGLGNCYHASVSDRHGLILLPIRTVRSQFFVHASANPFAAWSGWFFCSTLYTIYQQVLIHRIRRQLTDQEQMFRLITENAEDLITVVDRDGKRLYDSPGYTKLGYSNKDLGRAPFPEQIHPDDRERASCRKDGNI